MILDGDRSRASDDGGEPDRACAHHGDDVARLHTSVEHADLVAGREDVGQHQHLFVADPGGHAIGGRVRERHPDLLGLRAVDEVAQDPSATADALAEAAAATVRGSGHRR